ncbi:hypothetical protein AK830_g5517 [Neonectria ditissima]|uniref:Uncharacterized protein n=1 Tax=Neonectria ditissima TaxID=78410 RepID=A0A0N8H778_9HYPO|nr:hypothetical protein AK830_g5517 [Neonectria ditissima]
MAERLEHPLDSSNQPDPTPILDSADWQELEYDGIDWEAINAEIQASLESPTGEAFGGISQLETLIPSLQAAQPLPPGVIRSSRSSPNVLLGPLLGDVASPSWQFSSVVSSALPYTPGHGPSSMLSTRNQIADYSTPVTDDPSNTLTSPIPERVTPISNNREELHATAPTDQSLSFMSMNDGSLWNLQSETTDLNLEQFGLEVDNPLSLSPRNLSYSASQTDDLGILSSEVLHQAPHSSPHSQLNSSESRRDNTANLIYEGAGLQASFNDFQASNVTVHTAGRQLERQLLPKPSSSQHSSTLLYEPPSSQPGVGPAPVSLAVLPPKGKRKQNTEHTREKIKNIRRSGAEPLESIIPFRAGNARAGKVRSEPMKPQWCGINTAVKTVSLFYPFKARGSAQDLHFSVKCRKFLPREWDVLVEPWTSHDGEVVRLTSTPYACYDVHTGAEELGRYLEDCKSALLHEAANGIEDDLINIGIAEAERYAFKNPCVVEEPPHHIVRRPISPPQSHAHHELTRTSGDSFSKTGFNATGTQPSSKNPLGNPRLPGVTSSGGGNWVGFMVTEFNTSLALSYNFARSGATVDTSVIRSTAADLIQQVQRFEDAYGLQRLPKGRTRWNTVAGIWMGINDIRRSYYLHDASDLLEKAVAQYFVQIQRLYDMRTRKFVLLTVPPIDLTPSQLSLNGTESAKLVSAINLYNKLLRSNLEDFKTKHPDIAAAVIDTSGTFYKAVRDPGALGARDSTCINRNGVSCLWWDDAHPAIAMERLVAVEVAKVLESKLFRCYGNPLYARP